MIQDLVRSATVVSTRAAAAAAPTIAPLPLEPGETDLNETSLDNLAALADVAFRAGDRVSAEAIVRRLYAQHDRRQSKAGAVARQAQGAVE